MRTQHERKTMLSSLTSTVVAVKQHFNSTTRWIYQKTFSTKDYITFYDMLTFLLDNNKSLQKSFLDMRNVFTYFGCKHHLYAVLLTDCIEE
ncbi:MAG: hypothetical protein ACL7BU_14960 [Candidatus Phlomobacter fragariae]